MITETNVYTFITIANVQFIGHCENINKEVLEIKFPRLLKLVEKNKLALVKIPVYGSDIQKPALSSMMLYKQVLISINEPTTVVKKEYIKSLMIDGNIKRES